MKFFCLLHLLSPHRTLPPQHNPGHFLSSHLARGAGSCRRRTLVIVAVSSGLTTPFLTFFLLFKKNNTPGIPPTQRKRRCHLAEHSAMRGTSGPWHIPVLCMQDRSRPARDCLQFHLHRGSCNRAAVCSVSEQPGKGVRLLVASAECSAPACRDAMRASATAAPEQGSTSRAAAEGMSQPWCHEGPCTAICGEPRIPSSIRPLSHANDCQHETEAVKGKKITP